MIGDPGTDTPARPYVQRPRWEVTAPNESPVRTDSATGLAPVSMARLEDSLTRHGYAFVEDDEHVVGNAVQEGGQRVGADGRSGRVVGGADEHQAGAVGDRRSHRVEVVPAVSGQGHHDR